MCGDCSNEEVRVAHAPWRSRFEATAGERLAGVVEYGVRGTWAVLSRVQTDGRDVVARRLVSEALDLLRSRGYRILSECPRVTAFLRAHPELLDGCDEFPVGIEQPRALRARVHFSVL